MRTVLCVLILATSAANACLNVQGVTLDGRIVNQIDRRIVAEFQERMSAEPSSRLVELEESTKLAVDEIDLQELDAVHDVFAGRINDAIAKLTAMEQANPGSYNVAANLGTAYELAGDNVNALKWISEGITRNTDAHFGTEWLHKLILETKIALAADPDFLDKNHVLPFVDSLESNPGFIFVHDGKQRTLEDVSDALVYQLKERMLFVKPTDPVVADLLYCLGQIQARTGILEFAVDILELSREYGFRDLAALELLIEKYKSEIADSWWSPRRYERYIVTAAFVLFAVTAIVLKVLSDRKKLRLKKPPALP